MHTSILIPTDGSELASKAVQHGIALAKQISAKVTVLTVLPPFHTLTTDARMIEDTPAQYKARMHKEVEKTPVVALTARKVDKVTEETLTTGFLGQRGVERIFKKPPEIKELFTAVQHYCAIDHSAA
jgi:nucleotide-binding universal stress UspA family protein